MKEINMKNLPKDVIYKDVVIIGNGPSGISLSYMLSGHWPYWTPGKINNHPDELLRARLNYADNKISLVLQDLVTLADGLEGRSTNPVSLLLDSLEHPCADLGIELPSMLEYKYHPEKQIDHIVLGRGPAGGSWHRMDPNLRTLSLSAWMSLPGLDFNTWELNNSNSQESINDSGGINDKKCLNCDKLRSKFLMNSTNDDEFINNNESETGALCCKCSKNKLIKNEEENISISQNSPKIIPPRKNLSLKKNDLKEVQTRALISKVAEYYESYVKEMNLEKYFVNNTIVTSVTPVKHQGSNCPAPRKDTRWIVCGFNKNTNKPFCFACKDLVLANGSSDLANRLGLRSEGLATPWLKHELPQLEAALESVPEKDRKKLKPVLIVGAGLSAADAVTICRSSGIKVIHVYRNRTAGLDKMLPENVYPEYHEVHKMMKNSSQNYDCYVPLPEHTISDISHTATPSGNHIVTVQHLKTGETRELEISFATILIGARPDLRFLKIDENQDSENTRLSRRISWLKHLCAKCKHLNLCDLSRRSEYKRICGHNYGKSCECNKTKVIGARDDNASGIGIGEDPTKPIDGKSNPISVDKYTNAILKAPKGLYAMGPLVGDNFVRFIPGGALAIISALHKVND